VKHKELTPTNGLVNWFYHFYIHLRIPHLLTLLLTYDTCGTELILNNERMLCMAWYGMLCLDQ